MIRRFLPIGLFVLVAFSILYPNSFGNNPDIIQDESYFLTSALSSIQSHTLPGWEFSPSGSYYGGIQTYIDTVAIVPVLAGIALQEQFSLVATKVAIALRTGDLLHTFRVVNGGIVVAALGFSLLYFYRRSIPTELARTLLLLLFLLLSNSLVQGFVHTAKVWTIALVIDVALGMLFVANEYYRTHTASLFVSKKTTTAFLIWGGVLAFFQNYVGVFSVGLWALYSLILKHISFADIFQHVRKWWWAIILVAATQVSFFYRGFVGREHPSLLDYADNSTRTAANTIDWFHRLYDPLTYALQSQPLILLYPIGILVALLFLVRHRTLPLFSERLTYIGIAILHPVLVFLFFHGVLGFSLFPRFALMVTVAGAFSIAMLLSYHKGLQTGVLLISGVLCVVVSAYSVFLYWNPSSAVLLERTIRADRNSNTQAFIIDPTASRVSLPLNAESVAALNERKKDMSRFQFLEEHLDAVAARSTFSPLVLFADTETDLRTYEETYSSTHTVWTVSQDCSHQCTAAEETNGICFMTNPHACTLFTTEEQKEYPLIFLQDLLSQTGLGITYIVRQIP